MRCSCQAFWFIVFWHGGVLFLCVVCRSPPRSRMVLFLPPLAGSTCKNARREYANTPNCYGNLPIETAAGSGSACAHW
jgi:hypothetical protein